MNEPVAVAVLAQPDLLLVLGAELGIARAAGSARRSVSPSVVPDPPTVQLGDAVAHVGIGEVAQQVRRLHDVGVGVVDHPIGHVPPRIRCRSVRRDELVDQLLEASIVAHVPDDAMTLAPVGVQCQPRVPGQPQGVPRARGDRCRARRSRPPRAGCTCAPRPTPRAARPRRRAARRFRGRDSRRAA